MESNIDVSLGSEVTLRDAPSASFGRIDQYMLLSELGTGGFGSVFLAEDTVSGTRVAVKGLPPMVRNIREELENVRKNFALVSRLHHPNIAAALVLHPVRNAEYADRSVAERLRVFSGDTMMVMEFAPGVTLSQWRKQFPDGCVPQDKAEGIVRQLASALDYAHEQKIIHRDVKPSNVMIETRPDGSLVARVLDFGLAAEIRSSMGRVSQQVTDTSGTRPYMAPEQWLGRKQTAATDQYALAVLYYELLTGEVPFGSVFETGDPVVMMNVVGREPPELVESLPGRLRRAFLRAFAKDPRERYETCMDFVSARPVRRVSGWALAGAVVALGLAAAVAYVFCQRRERARQDAQAQIEVAERLRAEGAERERQAKVRMEKEEAQKAEERRAREAKVAAEEAARLEAEKSARILKEKADAEAAAAEAAREAKAVEAAAAEAKVAAAKAAEEKAAREAEAKARRIAFQRYSDAKEKVLSARQQAVSAQAAEYAAELYEKAEVDYGAMNALAREERFAEAESNAVALAEQYATARAYSLEHPLAWYARGRAAERKLDRAEALRCYRKALDGHVPDAALALGMMHLKGQVDGRPNDAEAAKMFREGALLGNAHGQYLYGGCLARARGVAFDKTAAREWMALAEIGGNQKARDYNTRAAWQISESDRKSAREILDGACDAKLGEMPGLGVCARAVEVRRHVLAAAPVSPKTSETAVAAESESTDAAPNQDDMVSRRLVGRWTCHTSCKASSSSTPNQTTSTEIDYEVEFFADGRLHTKIVSENSAAGKRESQRDGHWSFRDGRLRESWGEMTMVSDVLWRDGDSFVYKNDISEYVRLLNETSAKAKTTATSRWSASYNADDSLCSSNEMSHNGQSWTIHMVETPRLYRRQGSSR